MSPSVQAAVLEGPFPFRAQADMLEQGPVAEIDARRGSGTVTFEMVPQPLIPRPHVVVSTQTDTVGRIGDNGRARQIPAVEEIPALHTHAAASGQPGQILPRGLHGFRIPVAAADQGGRTSQALRLGRSPRLEAVGES